MKIKALFIFTLVVIASSSCEDMLEVKTRSSLTEELMLKDVITTQSYFYSTLAAMRNQAYYGRDFILSPELLADNCKLVNAGDRSGRGLNQSINLSGTHLNIWFMYQAINRLNQIIAAIESGEVVVTNQADQVAVTRIQAQSYFLRGLFYHDLVKTYAYNPNYILKNWDKGVPYITEPVKDKGDITYPSRPTVLSVYENIEADLLKSIALFTETGTPNLATGTINVKYVPTRAAAQALLSRFYLYWAGPLYPEKYALAIKFADDAIASGFALNALNGPGLVTQWTASTISSESFLEVNFAIIAENLAPDNCLDCWYTRDVNPTTGARVNGWGDVIASEELVAIHDQGLDVRYTGLMRRAQRDFEPVASRETRKYKSITTTYGLDNVPILRLPEVYLNRAEAHLLGTVVNETQARADINVVRTRAGLAALDGTVTGAALIAELYAERRRELAFEGHRLFDLTRRGLDVPKPGGSSLPKDDFRVLANIPIGEIQANENLEQNPGY